MKALETTGDLARRNSGPPSPKPYSISFFANGMVCVGDQNGNQIPRYNGRREEAIKALKADGYDWRELPDIWP